MRDDSWRRRFTRLRERLRDDRGSLSMAVVIWTPIVMVLCAFVVNIGFLIADREKANDLAEQAARRVADEIDPGVLKEYPGVLRIDVTDPATSDCSDLAQKYFTENADLGDSQFKDITSVTCNVTNNPSLQGVKQQPGGPTQVTVTIRMTHRALFTGFGSDTTGTVVALGTATPIQVPAG